MRVGCPLGAPGFARAPWHTRCLSSTSKIDVQMLSILQNTQELWRPVQWRAGGVEVHGRGDGGLAAPGACCARVGAGAWAGMLMHCANACPRSAHRHHTPLHTHCALCATQLPAPGPGLQLHEPCVGPWRGHWARHWRRPRPALRAHPRHAPVRPWPAVFGKVRFVCGAFVTRHWALAARLAGLLATCALAAQSEAGAGLHTLPPPACRPFLLPCLVGSVPLILAGITAVLLLEVRAAAACRRRTALVQGQRQARDPAGSIPPLAAEGLL